VRGLRLDDLSNDFQLGFQLFAVAVADGWPVTEVPAFSRYFPEASSNPLLGSIVYGLGTLRVSFKAFMHRIGLGAARKRLS
jgi:hypothetical protein